jgi:hypothetical protein
MITIPNATPTQSTGDILARRGRRVVTSVLPKILTPRPPRGRARDAQSLLQHEEMESGIPPKCGGIPYEEW